jgi:hypothetical protein
VVQYQLRACLDEPKWSPKWHRAEDFTYRQEAIRFAEFSHMLEWHASVQCGE